MMEAVQSLSEYELERGKPMPSKNHSLVQSILIGIFLRYSKQFSILSELSLKLGDFQPTPDISVYSKLPTDWIHDEIKMTEPPLLVVEIMSPQQMIQDIVNKIEKYFANGVKSCWFVQPFIQTITVFTPEMHNTTYTTGKLKDHVTGIEVSIEEVFLSTKSGK